MINYFVTKSIYNGIARTISYTREIAEGNLNACIDMDQEDEIGTLTKAIEAMVSKLREVVRSIGMGSDEIAAASHQVSAGSLQISKGANEQAVSAEEIAGISRSTIAATAETDKILHELIPDVIKTIDLVKEIAAASSEQKAGVEQVNNAIHLLNNIIQENAASAEELATGAEELANQSDQLRLMISYFRHEME